MTLFSSTRFGQLDLYFARRGEKTVLLRDVQKAPLMIVRPFELPCGTLMVFIVNPTGGVLGGDQSEIKVRLDAGARVLLLTQSATRLQPSASGETAQQDVHFMLADSARLEYYPERTIPFAASRFAQTVRVDLAAGAEFGLTESLASGRVHTGERLAFDSYFSRVAIYRGQQRIFLDSQHFDQTGPAPTVSRAAGLWGGADYVSSGVWVGQSPDASRLSPLPLDAETRLAWGTSHGGAVWLRGAARQGLRLDEALRAFRAEIRQQLFGAKPLQIRR